MERINYSSGSPLEESTGYSRMVKVGNHIYIGGTTSISPDGEVIGETAGEQASYIFEKFIGLLARAGAKPSDVTKIKGYLTDISLGRQVAAVFSEYFHDTRPLFTLIGTPALNRPSQKVELELEAVVGCTVLEKQ